VRRSAKLVGIAAAWLAYLAASSTLLAQADALARAHELYNLRQYDESIRLADQALQLPGLANAAAVVFARAHLERYRQTLETPDLDAARTALTDLDKDALAGRDRVDWTVGMGEVLYFDRRFSTAAEFFETALAHLDLLELGARDRLVEWWASALDQQAQLGPEAERRPLYVRILARAEEELRRDDQSAVGSYWLAAASLGLDDLDRAWAAAEAGWMRGASAGAAGARLRADLDRLVLTAIIPGRARHLSPTGDARPAATLLQQQWQEMKEKYGKGS
jgi:hypothetical protein